MIATDLNKKTYFVDSQNIARKSKKIVVIRLATSLWNDWIGKLKSVETATFNFVSFQFFLVDKRKFMNIKCTFAKGLNNEKTTN